MTSLQYARRLAIWRSSFLILTACTAVMLAVPLIQ